MDLLVEKGTDTEEDRVGETNDGDDQDHHQVLHAPKLHISPHRQHAQCYKFIQQSGGR